MEDLLGVIMNIIVRFVHGAEALLWMRRGGGAGEVLQGDFGIAR